MKASLTNLPAFEHPHLPRSASPLVFTNPGWDTESVLQTAPPGSIHKIMVMKKRSGSVKMLTCAKVTGNHYDSMIYEVNGSKARLRTNLLITTSPPDAHKRRGSAHNHWGCLSHKLKGVRWWSTYTQNCQPQDWQLVGTSEDGNLTFIPSTSPPSLLL